MTEKQTHIAFCKYMKLQYPDLIFITEASGLRLPIGMAKQLKSMRSTDGLPDIFIARAVRPYNGLFIELKRDGEKLTKLDGTYKTPHLENQATTMRKLYGEGYAVGFAIGLDEAVSILRKYMAGNYKNLSI